MSERPVRLAFLIEGPPVGKERARRSPRSGRWYTPPRTREAQRAIAMAFRAVSSGRGQSWTRPAEFLDVVCVFAGPKHPDPDNVLKLVLDALQGLAYQNDKAVSSSVTFSIDPKRPRLELTLR